MMLVFNSDLETLTLYHWDIKMNPGKSHVSFSIHMHFLGISITSVKENIVMKPELIKSTKPC